MPRLNGPPRSVLREVLAQSRRSFVFAGFFSLLINVLLLVPSMYMLAIYGRVLTSGSESTLWMLTLIALFLIVAMGALEWVRSQILIATSTRIDRALGAHVFDATFRESPTNGSRGGTQPLTDVQQLRQFLAGQGLVAFFDAPWSPIYVALLFAFHPWFGVLAALSVMVLLMLAVATELATRGDLHDANVQFIDTKQFTQGHLRNAEVIAGLGMLPPLQARWQRMQDTMLALQARASVRGGLISAVTRTFRIAVQSAILGVGAYLTIEREITAGHIFAGSLVLARALAPLDQLIGGWRGFAIARESYRRLRELLERNAGRPPPMALPPPSGRITAESLIVTPPGGVEPIIKGIGFGIAAGELIALIGPSGSGKSTLARTLLGLRPVLRGAVRYDGADVQQWDRAALGAHVGYLPQDVELLDGTVSDNVARFGEVDAAKVIDAARRAGIHDLILKLPQGYDTVIGSGGMMLSAGQQQRLGIARALYGLPAIVVLDEPNSNLDQAGEHALLEALRQLKGLQRTVIVVTHRNNVLEIADKVLMLVEGRIVLYAPREEARAEIKRRQQSANVSILRPLP